MEIRLGSRLKHAWNAFLSRDPTKVYHYTGPGSAQRPDRPRLSRGVDRSIISTIENRIALDASSITIQHVRLDDNDRFKNVINSGLNARLNLSANKDQTGRAFLQDAVLSMLDEGCVALVPVDIDTEVDPENEGSLQKIESMRVGKVIEWYPDDVRLRVYNDRTGLQEEITLPKSIVAIVENPFYSIMNEPNSIIQRLNRKFSLLDAVDERSNSGRWDLIIQLPYTIKTPAKQKLVKDRLDQIEDQLAHSSHGIAYIDSTEHVTQLNRSVENNLMSQIEYLTNLAFSQLGITQEILNGTADEGTMLNYYSRIIEPIVSAIVDEMKRKFLTKTARTQKQTILFFRDPFKLVPINSIAEIADKFTRNEIMTSNEIRQAIGMKPSSDPKADELRNSNITQPDEKKVVETTKTEEGENNQNGKTEMGL